MTKSKKTSSVISGERLESDQRIRREWEFKFVFDHGKFARGTFFHLWFYQDKEGKFSGKGPKLGIIVGKKVHLRANVRNLWKRRMREVFRRQQGVLKPNGLILLQAKNTKKVPSYQEMKQDLEKLFEKTGSFK